MTLRTRQLETASTVSLVVVVLLVVAAALRQRQTVTPSRVDLDSKAWAGRLDYKISLGFVRFESAAGAAIMTHSQNGALLMTGDVIDLCCTHYLLSTSFGEKGALVIDLNQPTREFSRKTSTFMGWRLAFFCRIGRHCSYCK